MEPGGGMSLLREITERYRLEKILKSTRWGSVLRATDAMGGGTVQTPREYMEEVTIREGKI